MKVLSLFDGISCARVALERAGIPVEAYYASEIDKYAMQISAKNWSDIEQVGDVSKLYFDTYSQYKVLKSTSRDKSGCLNINEHTICGMDLLIGGSPCQDLSIAKAGRKGHSGDRSGLFWEYVRILNEVKPKYFVLENVASMPKEAKDLITKTLGVEPIMIDAALVSAQRRKRLFWVGKRNGDKYEQVHIELPEDRVILLKDILEKDVPVKDKSNTLRLGGMGSMPGSGHDWDMISTKNVPQSKRVYGTAGKSVTLSANGGGGAKTGLYIVQMPRGYNKGGARALDGKTPTLSSSSWGDNNKLVDGLVVRKLSPIECERLQSLPDNYTEGVSNTQRYKALGNAFNVDVVAHILSFIK